MKHDANKILIFILYFMEKQIKQKLL